MSTFLLVLAVLTMLFFLTQGMEVTIGARTLAHLEDVPPITHGNAPRISVVIPACNEERGIEQALASVLAQDYPDFEVIAVDDRSTDSTGAILDRMAAVQKRLRVVHVRELPAGWLGKNNALQQGATLSGGSILLFTDADVVMDPSVLRRSAAYLLSNGIDHLAISPRAEVGGFFSNCFLAFFALGFTLFTKPWKVRDPSSRYYIGIGAFNMVRAEAYWGAGGHAPIAMRPDDDMKLGKLLKQHGYRQDLVFGTRLLWVEWYASFTEMRNGLMKNLFAATGYSVPLVLISVIVQALLYIWPIAALFSTRGPVLWVNAAALLVLIVMFKVNSKFAGISAWWTLTLPLATVLCIYLMLRATYLTLANDGIDWRGTHYPLAALRANRI